MKTLTQYILRHLSKIIIHKYDPDIIGITGSVGKTSAKEAIKTILNDFYHIRVSEKNYNNEIGVPLTIIGIIESPGKSIVGWLKVLWKAFKLILLWDNNYPEILVLEMGADKEGDISYLTDIAPCKIGILTNVSESHLEFFGSIEKVRREKKKILNHLNGDGYALFSCDTNDVNKIKNEISSNVLTFGFDKSNDISVSDIVINYNDDNSPSGINFKLLYNGNVVPIFIPNVLGFAHIYSALIAVGVGAIYEINLVDIAEKLTQFKLPKGRMNLIKGIKNTLIIDDTYNSSPASSIAALEVLQDLKILEKAKKIAILGDMLELGKITTQKHKEIGHRVAESGVDILITKGEAARDIANGALKNGMDEEKIFSFSNNENVGRFIQERIKEGDIILVKGSQGMRMEKIVKEIMARPLLAKDLLVRQGKEWK